VILDILIGNGAIIDIPPGALTNLCMRIKVGSTYYKIQLMTDSYNIYYRIFLMYNKLINR